MKKIIIKSFFAAVLLFFSMSANAQLALNSAGYITYGNTDPYTDGTKYYNLTMKGNLWLKGPSDSSHFFQIDTNPAATRIASHDDQVVFYNTGTSTFNSIQVKSVYNYSDARAKKDIQTLSSNINSMSKVLLLRPVKYNFNDNAESTKYTIGGDGKQIGLLAQEVEQVLPNVVLTDPDGKKLINYTELIPILINAIQELNTRVAALEK